MAINTKARSHQLVMCSNVMIRKGDQFLMLKRSLKKLYAPGVVHPVGGKIEPNEDPYTAAVREVMEESGLTVTNMRLRAVVNEILPPPNHDVNWLIYHFMADYEGGEQITTHEGELVWLTADEVLEGPLFASLAPLMEEVLNGKQGPVFATYRWHGKEAKLLTKNICAL